MNAPATNYRVSARKNNRRGFTLAEMIAAIALLAVFSVIVVQLFAASQTLIRNTDRLDSAVLCARNLAEGWQAGLDQPEYASLAENPFAGGAVKPAKPLRLTYDKSSRIVAADSGQVELIAELSVTINPQASGTEIMLIKVTDSAGVSLYEITTARLLREVTP